MLDWFINNSVWILVVAAVLMLVGLIFNERFRKMIAKLQPSKWHQKAIVGITSVFWIIEGIIILVVILAFVAMFLESEGVTPVISQQDLQSWFTDHGLNILVIIIVGIVLWFIVKQALPRLVRRAMARPKKGESQLGMRKRTDTLQRVFIGLARVIIIVLVIFMILSELNVAIGPVLAGFGIAGVALGFGAQWLIKDLIAGVFVLMENQYRVGDVVKIADVTGLVEDINMRKTVLRDLDGIVHHVPNGEIRVASNYSRHFARVNLNISVAYDTDLDYAIKVINRICKELTEEENWKKRFKSVPQVLRVDNLGDSGIDIKILGDVEPLEQWSIMGELRLRIKKVFDDEGIEIPWPHTKVYFGNKPGD
jgi:small-conductance mechanosensitive channel